MKKIYLIKSVLLVLVIFPFAAFAEAPKIAFEANKNQWPDQVKFQAKIPGGDVFLEKNTFTYNYVENINWHRDHRNESGGPVKVKYHAFKVNFENSNTNVAVSGNKRYSWHRNYYLGNDPKKWAENVPVYSEVIYEGLYHNINMKVYNFDNNFKYDFIVYPEGNTKNIKLNFVGTDALRIENGHLFIKTSLYDLIEEEPYAYQLIDGQKKKIACAYVLKNNSVCFELGNYDHSLPLIIDPTRIAATYSGSYGDNWGYTATYDNAGNIYIGGICARSGYPYTIGAWDSTFNGGTAPGTNTWPFDISLSKFNPTGTTLMYATYYGGSNNEQPHSIMVNNNNELYVVGRTNSGTFPTTAGAYQTTLRGGYDVIVGRFNSVGYLLGSTYIGGTSDDCVNYNINWGGPGSYGATKFSYTDDGRSEIILDANSNVYVAANSRSSNFPTTGGAYQSVFGGTQDAVVFKMNSTLTSLTFSTYLGGSGTDAAYGLKLDNGNNVNVTGGTTGNFPTTAGVLHQTYQGGTCDGFIAVLNSTGTSLLRSTYLGTSAYDQSYLIEIDASGDLYVYGQTQGAYPTTAGVYKNNNSGQFVHKVKGNLATTVFSTVIGTGPASGTPAVNLSPTAFLVDSCQTIYIAGWARNSALSSDMPFPSTCTGMPVTPNAFQSTTDGKDHYFMVLEPNAKGLSYATFYGENGGPDADHVDGGTSRFDKRGVIYEAFCASCGGTNGFPTMPGAYSTSNNGASPNGSGNNCNEAVVKMDIAPKPFAAAQVTGPTNGCAPFKVSFDNSGSSATDYIWDFGDGGVSYIASPSYTFSFPGTYTITLFAIDTIGICGFQDTAYVKVKVGASPSIAASATNISCFGGLGTASVTVTPNGASQPLTYNWLPSGGSAQTASGLSPGTYSVTVADALGCSNTKTVSVSQPTVLTLTTSATTALCGASNGSATATAGGGTPGYTYLWNPGGKTTSSITGIPQGNYSVTLTDANACTKFQVVSVPVANGPSVTLTATNPVSCYNGTSGSATATLSGGTSPYTYVWSPPAGSTANATGLIAGIYSVTITDANGCSGTKAVTLTEPPAIVASVSHINVKCFGDNTGSATVTASGGTGAYTYAWSTTPVQTTQTATGLAAGSYSVLIKDANGCSHTQSISVIQPVAPLATTTSPSGYVCGSYNFGVAHVIVTGGSGTPPYTFKWLPGGQTTSMITNLQDGTYSVTTTDANGCTNLNTVVIPKNTMPVADFTYTPRFHCDGVIVDFTNTGTDGLTWHWTFSWYGTSTDENPSFTFPFNNISSTYDITMIASNPPCADTITKNITINDVNTFLNTANIFSPNGDGENDCFHPVIMNPSGQSIETLLPCMALQVFDRWGVKMYDVKKDDPGTHCWNGNNQQDNRPAVDGTYYYIATLDKTTITGYVTLARHK